MDHHRTGGPPVQLSHVAFFAGASRFFDQFKDSYSQWDTDANDLGPDCYSMSCKLLSLTRMVSEELRKADSAKTGFTANPTASPGSMFERGRFYDLYSSRRNERLKRMRGEQADERKSSYDLDVMVESAKRKDSKKLESAMKSERNETPAPRYLLRSSMKESKKPPPGSVFGSSAACSERRIGVPKAKKY